MTFFKSVLCVIRASQGVQNIASVAQCTMGNLKGSVA
uniref:Uncharacterized protein n=1 Tax=Anguilla anguilla TaxID=7936 RepID=A0A0E9SNZ0_ANGAN